jgi:hypothetical protein
MYDHSWPVRVLRALAGAAAAAGVLGGFCDGTMVSLPLGEATLTYNTLTVELVNTTAWPVAPRLFVAEDNDTFDVDADENRVYVAEPIGPGQTAGFNFPCGESGAIETDHSVQLGSWGEERESESDPIVRLGDDYECGDTISFIFVDEPGEDFDTRVAVNGHWDD